MTMHPYGFPGMFIPGVWQEIKDRSYQLDLSSLTTQDHGWNEQCLSGDAGQKTERMPGFSIGGSFEADGPLHDVVRGTNVFVPSSWRFFKGSKTRRPVGTNEAPGVGEICADFLILIGCHGLHISRCPPNINFFLLCHHNLDGVRVGRERIGRRGGFPLYIRIVFVTTFELREGSSIGGNHRVFTSPNQALRWKSPDSSWSEAIVSRLWVDHSLRCRRFLSKRDARW